MNIKAIRNTIRMIVNRNVNDAPCDDAIRIGLFSLRLMNNEPIPKFKDTIAKVINPILIEEVRYNASGKFRCEK
jgi:hypothetical protein